MQNAGSHFTSTIGPRMTNHLTSGMYGCQKLNLSCHMSNSLGLDSQEWKHWTF